MARKSKLTPEQWQEIKRRHIVDGEKIRALAAEFGVDESSIRDYLKKDAGKQKGAGNEQNPQKPAKASEGVKEQIKSTAIAVVDVLKSSGLPPEDQEIALASANQMVMVRSRLNSVADNMASAADTLSSLVKQNSTKLAVGEDGVVDAEKLKQVIMLTQGVNAASVTGIDLIKIDAMAKNKEADNPKKTIELINVPRLNGWTD